MLNNLLPKLTGRRRIMAFLAVALLAVLSIALWEAPRTTSAPRGLCPVYAPDDTFAELVLAQPSKDHVQQLGFLWRNLTTIFHDHPPSPRRLLRPTLGRPANSDDFTIELADNALGITPDQAKQTRKAHRQVLAKLPDLSTVSPPWHGRGIVILAGGRYSEIATTTISILRLYHHSSLPVELWIGNDGTEDDDWVKEMQRMGVSVRWLADYAPLGSISDWYNPVRLFDERPWSPYQWKIMAVLFSSFEEVLFLDADSVPASDPEHLFDTEQYRSTGAIIWPDYGQAITSSWLPYLVGMSDDRSDILWRRSSAESGQMMLNKRTHWKSLLLATYYNYYGPSFWYTASVGSGAGWGDKDTYLLAIKALGEEYSMVFDWMESINARGTTTGVLNIQYEPRIGDVSIPAFYHQAGGFKWSCAEFMTVKRRQSSLWAYFKSTLFWRKSSTLATLLEENGRLFEERDWRAADPEALLWTGLQHVACWSTLDDEDTCTWIRERMTASLGVESVGTGSVHKC